MIIDIENEILMTLIVGCLNRQSSVRDPLNETRFHY